VTRYLWAPYREEAVPVNAFALEHPAGVVLFDTGQTSRVTQRGYLPIWHPFFRLSRFELGEQDEMASQLTTLGIAPADVRWIVLSHLHTDHVGGLPALAGPEVLVSRVEWERASGLRGRLRGYLPQHWPTGVVPTLLDLNRGRFGPFPGSHDVTGDGSVVIVATPGHTPGHVGLLVLRREGAVLLSGDLEHVRADARETTARVAAYCADEGIAVVSAHEDCSEGLRLGHHTE
jgi:glyoxylase-like metal-dependent hydrolase (beta-lactamase superfamily II)